MVDIESRFGVFFRHHYVHLSRGPVLSQQNWSSQTFYFWFSEELSRFNLYYTVVHLKSAFNERNLYSGLFTFHCDKINGIWAEIPAQDFTHDFIFNIHRYCFIEVSVTGTFLC